MLAKIKSENINALRDENGIIRVGQKSDPSIPDSSSNSLGIKKDARATNASN